MADLHVLLVFLGFAIGLPLGIGCEKLRNYINNGC